MMTVNTKNLINVLINYLKKFTQNHYVIFVASHKHEHLKGLIGQGGPLRLQDVFALAEGACVMVPNQSSSGFSSKLVSLELAAATSSSSFMQASTCNSMASLMALTQRAEQLLDPLKQHHHQRQNIFDKIFFKMYNLGLYVFGT